MSYAVITGATSGIGYELSKLLAKDRYDLIIIGRNKEKLDEIKKSFEKEYNISIKIYAADLSNNSELNNLIESLKDQSVDILVNAAGFSVYGEFINNDFNKEEEMINVNILALTKLTKIISKKRLQKKKGRIMNIASTGSFAPGPKSAIYCATKAYVLSFSEALSEELNGSGVTVTTICPGATNTNFANVAGMKDTKLFNNKVMEASKVAKISYNAMIQGKFTEVVGISNKILIGFSKIIPEKFKVKIAKSMME